MKLRDLFAAGVAVFLGYEIHRLVSHVAGPSIVTCSDWSSGVLEEEGLSGPGDIGFHLDPADRLAFQQIADDIAALSHDADDEGND